MSRYDALFADALDALACVDRRRNTVPVMPASAGALHRSGQTLLNFSSNDYLGLSRHPALAARAAEWGAHYGTGAGASRLVCGTMELHVAVEARLARLKGTEAAMLLASGWQANASVLAALLRFAGPGVQLFFDDLNHASLQHGARAAGVKPIRFRHNDMAHLTELLRSLPETSATRRIIVTESVFSMDGDRADLDALVDLAVRHDAFLYVDEAHATGVLGEGGMGLCAGRPGIDLVMGTFSKAFGSFGAYVAGSRALIDWLTNACAGFVYTTALPPPLLGAIDAALDLVPVMDADRARLAANAADVRTGFAALGIDTAGSTTQIIPALIGSEAAALSLAASLREAGILAVAIRPPTVPEGTSRLRFALSAAHGAAAIATLLQAVGTAWPSLRRAA